MICGPSSTICAIATAPKKLAKVRITSISGCIKATTPDIKNITEDVFAVDRWVRRGLINKLGYNEKLQNDKLSIKARKKYGNESSYIQQYIFFGEKS
mgnify:CR=1 FL=1